MHKWCQKIKSNLEYGYFIRLLLEVYLELAITSLVNLYYLKHSYDSWRLTGDMASGFFSVVSVVIVGLAPLVVGGFLLENRERLDDPAFESKYGQLIQSLRLKRYYNVVVFLVRRLLTALILVCLRGHASLQIVSLAYLQSAYIIYIGL